MRGRKVFGHLVTVYRYGREEDEVMGVKFSKEMIIAKEQVYPMVNSKVRVNEKIYGFSKKISVFHGKFQFNRIFFGK